MIQPISSLIQMVMRDGSSNVGTLVTYYALTQASWSIGVSHFLNLSLEKGLMGFVPVGNVIRLFDADYPSPLLGGGQMG